MRVLRSYRAYGLGILSELELPGLSEGDPADAGDLRIVLGPVEDPGPDAWSRVTQERVLLRFPAVGRLEISGGDRIVLDPAPDMDPQTVNAAICGSALGLAMTQRGLHSLHASAVEIDGHAVAFCGHSGDGKSTLVTALQSRGHRTITDDVVAIDDSDGTPRVLPSFPQVKLRPDSAQALGLDAGAMAPLNGESDKRAYRFGHELATDPVPLTHVYVLERGDELRVVPRSGPDAVVALLTHGYAGLGRAKFAEAADFERVAGLARSVRVATLKRPWSLDRLFDVVDLVERDAALVGGAR